MKFKKSVTCSLFEMTGSINFYLSDELSQMMSRQKDFVSIRRTSMLKKGYYYSILMKYITEVKHYNNTIAQILPLNELIDLLCNSTDLLCNSTDNLNTHSYTASTQISNVKNLKKV